MPKSMAKHPKKSVWRFCCKVLLILLGVILAFIALIDVFSAVILSSGYYLNGSASMPIGLYKVSDPQSVKKGDDVIVCLPLSVGELGLNRGYLDPGKCSGGYNPVIKELIAIPGDTVALTSQSIIVNGKTCVAPLRSTDHEGNSLAAIPRGEDQHTTSFWLYGAGNPTDSWDSRYWGGVSLNDIIKQAHPVLTIP